METLALAVILIASIAALARIVWRAVRGSGARGGACSCCPLAGECRPGDACAPPRDELRSSDGAHAPGGGDA